ncbi:MAG: hypothetical protein U1E43_01280 [Rhodospirillales bacterium]
MKLFRNGPDVPSTNSLRTAHADVFTNIVRAAIAEYLWPCAIGKDTGRRSSRDGYDLELDSITIEVKSSACFVSVKTLTKSNSYDIAARSGMWPPDGTRIARADGIARRCAHVYVFAFHRQTDRQLADTLDVAQWRFYVVRPDGSMPVSPTRRRSVVIRSQHFPPVPH